MRYIWELGVFIICIIKYSNAKSLSQVRLRRNAYRDTNRRWPNGVIPYTFEHSFSHNEKKIVQRAMRDIESVSCIRFKPRSNEKGYLHIIKGQGCSADMGYWKDRRKLTLGPGCVTYGVVLHELFHILGFFHEHNRPDRDNYVEVLSHNIKSGAHGNFNRKSHHEVTLFGLPYDFDSIVHYTNGAFAKHGHSLRAKTYGKRVPGKADRMSDLDIVRINLLYRCKKIRGKSIRIRVNGNNIRVVYA